jgi:hypothetical protein
MDPRNKSTRNNDVGSKKKKCEPKESIHSATAAKATHTPAQMIDTHSINVNIMMSSPPLQPSPNHLLPTYRSQPSQQRAPPASWLHYPSSYTAAHEEMNSASYADDYPEVYSDFPQAGVMYPPHSAAAVDNHNTLPLDPQLVYLPHATVYPSVDSLPQIGRHPQLQHLPSWQPSFYQPLVQPPTLQQPTYSNGQMFRPPLRPPYQPLQWASAAPSLLTAEQQLLYYSALTMPVDSTCPGLLELPTKKLENESDTTAGSTLSTRTLSLADTNRKFDEILGKRADQRTEEEKKFREEYLAARQSVHARDATDRKRRRLSDREKVSSWPK